jgi:hypothetical protein
MNGARSLPEILTPLDLAVLILVTMTTALLVGHASTKVISKTIKKLFGMNISLQFQFAWERVFAYSAIGFVLIIAYCIILSIFVFLNQIGVSLLVGLLALVELSSLINRQKKGELDVREYLRNLGNHMRTITRKWRHAFLLVLFVAGVIWYFSPAIMLANYPGGDDRTYLFITRQIVDNGSVLSGLNYPYAYPFTNNYLMSGFMVVASFFYNLLQTVAFSTSIPLIHLFLALLFFSLTPVSLYLFTMGLSKNRSFSIIVALTALFMWRSILMYFDWGGESEAMGYFIVPVLALVDYRLNETLMKSNYRLKVFTGTFIAKLFLVGIALYIHVYSGILFIFLVMIVIPLLTMRKNLRRELNAVDKIKAYLKIVAPYVMIFVVVIALIVAVAVLLQSLVIGNPVIQKLYAVTTFSPQEILDNYFQKKWTYPWLVFRSGYDAIDAIAKLVYVLSYFLGSWTLAFIGLYLLSVAFLRRLRKREELTWVEGREVSGLVSVMAGAGVIFFLFVQNSPFGWYYIPYPLAISMLASRLYYLLDVFMIYVEALPLFLIVLYIRKKIAGFDTPSRKSPHHRFTLNGIGHTDAKRIVPILVLIVFLAGITLPSMNSYYNSYAASRRDSVVTPNDLDAFEWVMENTPRNATFVAYAGDAGAYVYIYTGRIVLSPTVMRLSVVGEEASQDLAEIGYMLLQGNMSQQLFQLLKKYDVSYIYVGGKSQYGLPQFLALCVINSPQLQTVFHQGETYVFKIIYSI